MSVSRFIKILLLILMFINCVSCSCKDNTKRQDMINNEIKVNSLLTKMPYYNDNIHSFYAENGKILKDENNNIIIDTCDNEIISDVFYHNNILYYTKQDNEKITMLSVNTNDYSQKNILFIIDDINGFGMGDDFIYVYNNVIYYYNYYNNILYKYQNDYLTAVLENITSATFEKDNIYYADINQRIFKTDLSCSETTEIFNNNNVKNSKDDFLINWYQYNINDYSIIRDIAVYKNKIIFRICSDPAVDKGMMMCLDNGIVTYCNSALVQTYQINSNNIIAYGSLKESKGNINFVMNLRKNKILNISPAKYFYVFNKIIYYQLKTSDENYCLKNKKLY